MNLKRANGKIDNIALAAEPELLMGHKPRSRTTDKKAKRKNHKMEKLQEEPASATLENVRIKDLIDEERKVRNTEKL